VSEGAEAWSLQDGIKTREWPDEVRSATAGLRQGILVADPPFLYAAAAAHPVHDITRQWAQTARAATGAVVLTNPEKRPPYGVIATQTCDVVEEGPPKRPWVLLCPVYVLRVSAHDRNVIAAGRGFNYLCAVTGLAPVDDGIWVADLRLLVPVEKGWLVGRAAQPAFADESGFDRFADQLAALFGRRAFDAGVVAHVLRPTQELLRAIASELGGSDPIAEVGLSLGRSRLEPANVEIVFMLDGELRGDLRARIVDWWEPIAEAARDAGLELLVPRFVSVDELSAREYRALDLLDAAALSPQN
jgi:hypothetical protein